MFDDRQLMQQALEALKQSQTKAPFGADGVVYSKGVKIHEAAITALSERLAHCDLCGKRLGEEGDIHTCTPDPIGDAQDRLIAELAAQPEHEPVTVAIEHCLSARNERTPCPHTVSTPAAVIADLKWAVSELEELDDATVQFVLDVLRKHLVAGSFTPAQPAPAQQEPVGSLILGGVIDTNNGPEYEEWDVEWNNKAIEALQEKLVTSNSVKVTLNIYTAPPAAQPAQRQWTGLTDKQMVDAVILAEKATVMRPLMLGIFARAIEAKLKEINT